MAFTAPNVGLALAPAAKARRFIAIWVLALSATWLALAGFTAFVDPYAFLGAPRIAGLNERKFEMAEFGRIAKLREVARRRPEAIILGNSQAEGGLRSETLARLSGQRSYNLGFLGARIEETEVAFQHAVRVAPLRTVVLALDYPAFEEAGARANLLRARAERRIVRELRDFVELTLSMKGFIAALRGVALNMLRRAPTHDINGNWSVREPTPIDDAAAPAKVLPPAESAYNAFAEICRTAAARGIDLRLVAMPVHRAFGLDPAARMIWLTRLRAIAAEYRFAIAEEGGDAAFNADKRNFLDRGHITVAVGDAILERLFVAASRRNPTSIQGDR